MTTNIRKIGLVIFTTLFSLAYVPMVFAYSPLVANAGPDQYLIYNQYTSNNISTTLDGSATDPNGGNLNYFWSCSGGVLSNPNVAQPLFTIPNFQQVTSYVCTLNVEDNYGLSASDSVTIFVNGGGTGTSANSVQTDAATNYNSTSANLNGYLYTNGSVGGTAWFDWGTTIAYGSQSFQQSVGSGSFTQNIANLIPNTTYHFRAVAQGSNGQVLYGQDLTFYTNPNSTPGSGVQISTNNGQSFSITKQAVDLTSGNLTWSNYVTASPSDVLEFKIILQSTGSQALTNVIIKDAMPANLTYNDNLTVSGATYSGNIISGLSLGTLSPGQLVTISYQAQVAPAASFPYATTSLNNSVSLQSDQTGTSAAASNVIISVNKTGVLGAATTVSTGLTNNPFVDSFFIPLVLLIVGVWGVRLKIKFGKKKVVA